MSLQTAIRRLLSSPQSTPSAGNQERLASVQRVADTRRKTIEWLRNRPMRDSATRTQAAKGYVDRQKRRADELRTASPALSESLATYPKYPVIRGALPITAKDAKSVRTFLESNVDGDKTAFLKLPDGPHQSGQVWGARSKDDSPHTIGQVVVKTDRAAHGVKPPSFGLELSTSVNAGLQVTFSYRPVPGSLRLPENKQAQGGLSFRLATVGHPAATSARQKSKDTRSTSTPGEPNLAEAITDGVEALLTGDESPALLGYDTPPLDDVAWKDFSEYLHALVPSLLSIRQSPESSPEVVATLDELEDAGIDSAHLQGFLIDQLRPAISWRVLFDIYAYLGLHNPGFLVYLETIGQSQVVITVSERATDFLIDTLAAFRPDAAATLAEIFWALPTADTRRDYCTWIAATYRTPSGPGALYWRLGLLGPSIDDVTYCATSWSLMKGRATESWSWALKALLPPEETKEPPEFTPPYDFIYFTPGTWNLGLRLVYRQEWRALGNQRGEVVKTIPLGPRQTEKVSTRLTRRTKVVRTSEDLKSVETTIEQATSAKDSSETIKEASETFKWHAEAEASAHFGFGGASVSSGFEADEEERSKDTTSRLTESSQKMASKIRQETKVTVSTESEATFETATATEITNPNEEIALTYVYSKLQRQYRLFTQLSEVHNVLMIAEPVPAPEDIDDAWVRRHDSILAKALLDDSYRDVLASFGQDRPQESLDQDTLKAIKEAVDKVAGTEGYLQKLGDKAVSIALDRVDPSQEAQRGYRDTQLEELERKRAHSLLIQKQRRFKQHIRDNLLHYFRAIWSSEDPQQRALRYRKLGIRVPLQWEFVAGAPDAPNVISLPALLAQLQNIETGAADFGELPAFFRPAASSELIAVADLINNSGPIGYEGNYAIYYLNPRFEKTDLFLMLQILKLPYLDENESGEQTVIDPALKSLRRKRSGEGPASYSEQLFMATIVPELRLHHAIAKKGGAKDEEEFFSVFRLTKESVARLEASGEVGANVISDLRNLQLKEESRKGRNERAFSEFLQSGLHAGDIDRHRGVLLRYADQGIFTAFYPEYLLRKSQGSSFLLDTGNLVVDIVPGTGSALEAFKLMHRGIDVLKALEEQRRLVLENKRRGALIDTKKYGDPDIEKVTIVTGAKEAAGLVATSVETVAQGDTVD